MEDYKKLPLKRVELSLTKFNEVAIPHHLDLLRQHKANILKYEECGDYLRVRNEQTHARRVTSQLRGLLGELEALRRQLEPADLPKFDKLTQRSRELTLKAIMDYLESIPAVMECGSVDSAESVALVPEQLELRVEPEDELLAREQALLGWSELQAELCELRDVWAQLHTAVRSQRDAVEASAASVDLVADNVQVARQSLASAERLRAASLGVGGAVVGAAVGGPVGLMVGAKAGAAVALVGSLVGYFTARVLARSPAPTQGEVGGSTPHPKQQ